MYIHESGLFHVVTKLLVGSNVQTLQFTRQTSNLCIFAVHLNKEQFQVKKTPKTTPYAKLSILCTPFKHSIANINSVQYFPPCATKQWCYQSHTDQLATYQKLSPLQTANLIYVITNLFASKCVNTGRVVL